ncbi:hypothetical protein NFI96_024567 [Prochilodus magdalenae]|nr:hypothetical protein NFI96_024567 [Prochilodus magdalenae]
MATSTGVDQEEVIVTDTENEDVDEKFYMNRKFSTDCYFASERTKETPGEQTAQSVPCTSFCAESGNEELCRRANQSAEKDEAEHNQESSETEGYVGPDAEGAERSHSSSIGTQASSKVGTMKIAPISPGIPTNAAYLGSGRAVSMKDLQLQSGPVQVSAHTSNPLLSHDLSQIVVPLRRPKRADTSSKRYNKSPKTGKVLSVNNIHRQNWFGETPLHLAAIKGDVQSVKDMVNVGASVNQADNAGWTPLHEAVLHRHYTVVETLLKAGAEVNPKGYKGVTPLHDAVGLGNLRTIDLLLKHGADPLLKNESGDAAIDLNTDMSVQDLLDKYLPTAKREYLSGINVSENVSCASSAESGKEDPCRFFDGNATQPAEEKKNQESNEPEACVGPDAVSAEKLHNPSTETRASPKVKSSVQTIPPLRDQAKNTNLCGSLLVQDREILGSDTSSSKASDAESDVTLDYIETSSSSPGHWFLSATQDFSGSILS